MSDTTRITSRLNAALCVFVSVPLSALPAAAQEKLPGNRVGVRKLGVRVLTGQEVTLPGVRKPGIRHPGTRNIGAHVPERVGKRLSPSPIEGK